MYRNDYNGREQGDFFSGLLLFFVFCSIFVLIGLYIGSIILFIFLGVGVAIGLVYSIIVYIRSIISLKYKFNFKNCTSIKQILLMWINFFKDVSKISFFENFNVARNAIAKSRMYRFLSFRRWMWLIVAPSVIIIGSILICLIIIVQVLLFVVSCFILSVVLLISSLICLIINLFPATAFACRLCFRTIKNNSPIKELCFDGSKSLSEIFKLVPHYFIKIFEYSKKTHKECLKKSKRNIANSKIISLKNLKKYYLMVSPVALFLITYLVLMINNIFYVVIFLPLFICRLIKAIFRH